MRNCVLPFVAASAMLLALGLHLPAGAAADSITVELKTFKFKVPEDRASLFGFSEDEGRLFFYTNGQAESSVKVPADGEYEIVVKAAGDAAQNERAKFKVSVDGEMVGKEVLLTADEPKEYKVTAKVKAGDRKLVIEFTNDVYKENEFDRNLYVHEVTVKRVK